MAGIRLGEIPIRSGGHHGKQTVGRGIALAGVTAVAVGAYSYNYIQQQKSLRQGIVQTQQSLAKVDALVEQNQAEIVRLIPRVEIDLGSNIEGLSQVNVDPTQQVTPLGDVVDRLTTVSNGFEARKAFQNHDYGRALENAAEAVATVWGRLAPSVYGATVKYGAEGIDVTANLLEARALLRQQEQLIGVQATLQQQLFRLQGKDPPDLAEWHQILNNLHGDPATEHEAFLKWLAAKGLSEKDVTAKALANATSAGPVVASQFAAGLKIVDPNAALENFPAAPDINPDFTAAMQCDGYVAIHALSDPRWMKFSCAHYPDGTYIPAFGPCRGIDISDPFTGGLIASSTAECAPRRNAPGSPAAPRQAKAIEMGDIEDKIAHKLVGTCCEFETEDQAAKVVEEFRREIAAGRMLTPTGDPTRVLTAADVVVAERYSMAITGNKAWDVVGKEAGGKYKGEQTTGLDQEDRPFWPIGGERAVFSYNLGSTISLHDPYEQCKNLLTKTGPTTYVNHCEFHRPKQMLNGTSSDDRKWAWNLTLEVAGGRLEGQALEIDETQGFQKFVTTTRIKLTGKIKYYYVTTAIPPKFE